MTEMIAHNVLGIVAAFVVGWFSSELLVTMRERI